MMHVLFFSKCDKFKSAIALCGGCLVEHTTRLDFSGDQYYKPYIGIDTPSMAGKISWIFDDCKLVQCEKCGFIDIYQLMKHKYVKTLKFKTPDAIRNFAIHGYLKTGQWIEYNNTKGQFIGVTDNVIYMLWRFKKDCLRIGTMAYKRNKARLKAQVA